MPTTNQSVIEDDPDRIFWVSNLLRWLHQRFAMFSRRIKKSAKRSLCLYCKKCNYFVENCVFLIDALHSRVVVDKQEPAHNDIQFKGLSDNPGTFACTKGPCSGSGFTVSSGSQVYQRKTANTCFSRIRDGTHESRNTFCRTGNLLNRK